VCSNPTNKKMFFFFRVSLFYFSILVKDLRRADPRPINVNEYGVLIPILKVLKAGNCYVFSAINRDRMLYSE
jgi:hypothetical protein